MGAPFRDLRDAEDVRRAVEGEFRALDQAADVAKPGILELLRVYGGYDAALQQMDVYLRIENATPSFSTGSSTGR
jgi:hypothetical protein